MIRYSVIINIALVLFVSCFSPFVYGESGLKEDVSFTTLTSGTLMQDTGWKTVYAQNGGWGSFPTCYSYRVTDIESNLCLIDSYPHAQNHAHSNAILIDWDGNPANGQTPLKISPGLTMSFQLSAYIQPFADNWWRDGTGGVIWGFGPGQWHTGSEATTDNNQTPYDWVKDRGPRIQYLLGNVDGKQIPKPELRSFMPESDKPSVKEQYLTSDGQWYDLRLTITISDDTKQALCKMQARAKGTAQWNDFGNWSFPIEPSSKSANNPANWNALYLDLQFGIWSKKGYGTPEPQMQDRYDDFSVEVIPANSTGQPRKAKLLMFTLPEIGASISGPKSVFADDDSSWNIIIANNSGKELTGKLAIRQSPNPDKVVILDPAISLANESRKEYSKTVPGGLTAGDGEMQVVLNDKTLIGSTAIKVFAQKHPQAGVNIVRNAGFELENKFTGTPMRQGDEFFQMFVKSGDKMVWTALPIEAWWAEASDANGTEVTSVAHSGKQSLCVKSYKGEPRSVISSFNRMIPTGPVTLSAWIKTVGCKGRLDFDFISEWGQAQNKSSLVRKSVSLPADSDWTRITISTDSPQLLQVFTRVLVEEGTAYIDDVQIETGNVASAFNIRPEEWLRMSISGTDEKLLPQWVAGDKTTRKVTITNDSQSALAGQVNVYLGPWNNPTSKLIGKFDAGSITNGSSKQFTFTTDKLPPNAYLLCLSLDGTTQLPAQWSIATDQTLGGTVSNGMLRARTAARFVIANTTPPAKLFGIGNSMLDTNGSWFSGYGLTPYSEARSLGLTGLRTASIEENIYLAASVGAPIHSMSTRVDFGVPDGATFNNPADKSAIDVFNPEGFAFFTKRAEQIGKEYASSPVIASYQMSNESPYLNGGSLCPSAYADANFREWCKKRFNGDIAKLNSAWKTNYAAWDEVEQISSARFLEEEKNKPKKEGAAATDWLARTGTFSPEVEQRMKEHPGHTMDWLRWRTYTSVWMYSTFREHAKKYDKKTLYGTNLCWPAFWPQMFMPFTRAMDNTQLDIQYTSGLPRSLGTPYEMMDSMEMAETSDPTKPVWGIEIYVQPQWPAAFAALQNWGLLAHGMTNNLVFAWKPYSDYGAVIGNHAWEKPDAHPMWMLIDNDGTKLPAYYTYVRSLKEIKAYHNKYNGLSIKRAPTKTAFYVSPDTAEYVIMNTANKPWGSFWQRTRNTLIFLLRMNGVAVDYVDDATMPTTANKYTKMIVPASYVLNQDAAAKIAAFAKSGGTVVLAGMTGVVDPWVNKYDNIGGPAWADLAWKTSDYATDFAKVAFAKGIKMESSGVSATEKPGSMGGEIDKSVDEAKTFRGVGFGEISGATAIKDTNGVTVGWQRSWGKGKLIAYGAFPDSYATEPHASINMTSWLRQVIKLAGIPVAGRWVSKRSIPVYGPVGTGSEVVEVVVRQKSVGEKFIFCMNQGGAGSGKVEVNVGPGRWSAEDVITGKSISNSRIVAGKWSCPMHLDAWGYRVIRLFKTK